MRILYLVTKADLGGAQVHILDLLRGFQNTLEPVVAAGEEGYFTEAVSKLGIPYHIVPHLVHALDPINDCRALLEIARLIRSVQAEVVHAHTSKAGVVGRFAARLAGGLCSAIINVSEANRDLAVRHRVSDQNRMLTIWNGIPDTSHRARPDAS